jgi:hypothetical protein
MCGNERVERVVLVMTGLFRDGRPIHEPLGRFDSGPVGYVRLSMGVDRRIDRIDRSRRGGGRQNNWQDGKAA